MSRKSIIPILIAILIVILGVTAYAWNNANNDNESGLTTITDSNTSENETIRETSPAAIENPTLTLPLREINNSDQEGTVTFRQLEVGIEVVINLIGQAPGTSEPAYIHSGSCPNAGGIRYALTSVENGRSTSILNTDQATLINQMPLALAVHRSSSEIGIVVACADSSL